MKNYTSGSKSSNGCLAKSKSIVRGDECLISYNFSSIDISSLESFLVR